MKKILALAIIILFSFSNYSFSQCEIINPSFEEWTVQPLELDTSDGVVSNDVNLPAGVVTVLRFFLFAFGAFFDPTIGQILEDDPIGFIGIEQSMDASEGGFAVKLQGGYDVTVADIYSPNTCSEIPDSFFVDVKLVNHTGDIPDSLLIFLAFDQGLSPLPQTEEDAMNSPSSIFADLVYENDSTYHTLAFPVIDNFEAPVDTFYYLIEATTHEESYFLIDNLRFVNDNVEECQITVNAPITPGSNICMCDDRPDFYFAPTASSSTGLGAHILLDDNNMILALGDIDTPLFSQDICFDGSVSYTFLGYEDGITGLEVGANFDALEGCFEFTPIEVINSTTLDNSDFVLSLNGLDLPSGEMIELCLFDDTIELFSFSSGSTDNAICFLWDFDTDIIVAQIDIDATTEFADIDPGEYILSILYHDNDLIPDFVGEEIGDLTTIEDGTCIRAGENGYGITILDDSENCSACAITSEVTLEDNVSICLCDEREDPYFFTMVSVSDDGAHVLIDENDIIQVIGDIDLSFFNEDICIESSVRHTLVGYKGDIEGLEIGENINDLVGCFELSPFTDINTTLLGGEAFQMEREGELLSDNEEVELCISDDLVETFTFINPNNTNGTCFVIDDDTDIIVDQFDANGLTDFSDLTAGEYLVGILFHTVATLPDLVGQDIESVFGIGAEICFRPSPNFYTLVLIESGENCTSSTQDLEILHDFSIVENPVNNTLQISYEGNTKDSFYSTIIDVNGVVISSEIMTFRNDRYTYDTSSFPAGIYFIRIASKDGQATQKFIKN
jgi:hypothetical protein